MTDGITIEQLDVMVAGDMVTEAEASKIRGRIERASKAAKVAGDKAAVQTARETGKLRQLPNQPDAIVVKVKSGNVYKLAAETTVQRKSKDSGDWHAEPRKDGSRLLTYVNGAARSIKSDTAESVRVKAAKVDAILAMLDQADKAAMIGKYLPADERAAVVEDAEPESMEALDV